VTKESTAEDRASDAHEIQTDKESKVDRDSWLNTRLLKIIGIVYGLASPFAVWLVVSIYGHTSSIDLLSLRVKNLEEQKQTQAKMYEKLDDFKDSLNNLDRNMTEKMNKMQQDITILKVKANIQ
jgi:hypothetical protein